MKMRVCLRKNSFSVYGKTGNFGAYHGSPEDWVWPGDGDIPTMSKQTLKDLEDAMARFSEAIADLQAQIHKIKMENNRG